MTELSDLLPEQAWRWSLDGYPPALVDVAQAEADKRDDPLLAGWCVGQRAELRKHDYWTKHGTFDGMPIDAFDGYTKRRDMLRRYAFSVTSAHALQAIADFVVEGIVSVGAGTGWWEARLALEHDVEVLAFDRHQPSNVKNGYFADDAETFMPVRHGYATVGRHHPDRALMLSWPPYQSRMGATAIDAYALAGGRQVIYIGEGDGGCCGDDAMFSLLERDWTEVKAVPLLQWPGLHDELRLYERSHD